MYTHHMCSYGDAQKIDIETKCALACNLQTWDDAHLGKTMDSYLASFRRAFMNLMEDCKTRVLKDMKLEMQTDNCKLKVHTWKSVQQMATVAPLSIRTSIDLLLPLFPAFSLRRTLQTYSIQCSTTLALISTCTFVLR